MASPAVTTTYTVLGDDGTMDELYQQYFSTDAPEAVTNPK